MKRLISIFLIIIPMNIFAQTMCVRDKTLIISLDSSILGTARGSNSAEAVWWVDFPFGRIYGESTVLSAEESLGQTKSGAYYGAGEYSNTPIHAKPGLSGKDNDGNKRTHCWCRMTHPATSFWVLYSSLEYADCTGYCADYVRQRQGLRQGIFGSVGL